VRPGRAADHSPPSSAAVMEEYSYTSTHHLGHTGPVTGSLYLIFTLWSRWSEGLFYKNVIKCQILRNILLINFFFSQLVERCPLQHFIGGLHRFR